ncbi:hypothetical protein GC209_19280 [bacterium]|nr:hypothetical protein [bacterium]
MGSNPALKGVVATTIAALFAVLTALGVGLPTGVTAESTTTLILQLLTALGALIAVGQMVWHAIQTRYVQVPKDTGPAASSGPGATSGPPKALVALVVLVALGALVSACSPAPGGGAASPSSSAVLQDPRVQLALGCEAYATAAGMAAAAIRAGDVSTEGVQRIKVLRGELGPLCEAQAPGTDLPAVLVRLGAAVSEMTNIVGSKS